jgi:hypothetical protein
MGASLHGPLRLVLLILCLSLTAGENTSGHERNAIFDPVEYTDYLLKEKYGLDISWDEEGDVVITKSPDDDYDDEEEDELPQRDSTYPGRQSSVRNGAYTPAIFYNPTTMEEVPEEEEEEDWDVTEHPEKLQNLVNKLHKSVKASQTNQIRTR